MFLADNQSLASSFAGKSIDGNVNGNLPIATLMEIENSKDLRDHKFHSFR